eukprot:6475322-Pyramimonas_sp.AAC.1
MEEMWATVCTTVSCITEVSLGYGSPSQPTYVCGDVSGGADSSSNRFRRVGIAIVRLQSRQPFCVGASITGPLCGLRQTVPRGELRALLLTA